MTLSFTAQAQDNLKLYLSEPDSLEGITPRESDVSFTFFLGTWVFFAFKQEEDMEIEAECPMRRMWLVITPKSKGHA